MVKKKKKRKKSRYKRGSYTSLIAGECKFRSGWEHKYMIYLDSNSAVESWSYEKLIIEYVANKKTGKIRKYYPDFCVTYRDGSKQIIEIKQSRKLSSLTVRKKSAAAQQWCMMNGYTFIMLTEIELKQLGLI